VLVRWDVEKSLGQLGRRARWVLFAGLAVAAGVVAMTALRAVRPITAALDSVREQHEAMQASLRALAPSALPAVEPGRWHTVAVETPTGGLQSFDPVAGLAWVIDVARAWAPDATLERLEGGPLARDGTVDVAARRAAEPAGAGSNTGTDAVLSYRFLSPRRLAEWDRAADARRDLTADFRLELVIARGSVTASVTRGRPLNVTVPTAVPLLPLRDVLSRARAQGFPDRPFYAGSLSHRPTEGWTWRLATPSGRESFAPLPASERSRLP
jgi:hypothetical protein